MSDDGTPANGPDDGKPAEGEKPAETGGAGPNGPGADDGAGKPAEGKPADGEKPAELTAEEKLAKATEHSRTWENRAKNNGTKLTAAEAKATAAEEKLKAVLKAAGMAEDEEDPTEAVKRATAERDTAVAKATKIEAERLAEKVARGLGADVDRTLDSRAVEKALGALEDPTDTAAVKAVLEQALKDQPHLKAAPPARPSGSTELGGGEGSPGGEATTIDQIREQRRKRRGDAS